MSLARWGWEPFFSLQVTEDRRLKPGRVRLATARRVQVFTARSTANLSLPRNVGPAAVGDWVLFDPRRRITRQVLRRRNALARNRPGQAARRQVLAANIDAVLVVAGLDRAVSARLVDRFLVCIRESGAQPAIILNKADLAPKAEESARALRTLHPQVPVRVASAVTGAGLEAVEEVLPANGTVALAGPSGAGKSSVVNALLRHDRLRVGAVRARDRRGRHTTTRRELVAHPGGWLLMDLPGIRELCPWSSPETVASVFPEIAERGRACFFRDCRHASEPQCAVREAASDGAIDRDRLASYLELRDEQEELGRMREIQQHDAGQYRHPRGR